MKKVVILFLMCFGATALLSGFFMSRSGSNDVEARTSNPNPKIALSTKHFDPGKVKWYWPKEYETRTYQTKNITLEGILACPILGTQIDERIYFLSDIDSVEQFVFSDNMTDEPQQSFIWQQATLYDNYSNLWDAVRQCSRLDTSLVPASDKVSLLVTDLKTKIHIGNENKMTTKEISNALVAYTKIFLIKDK